MFIVSRQNGFYDTELRIEIATGRDEISPGMLVPNYDEEGEYDTATEAVHAAMALRDNHYPDETKPEITVSSAASIGLYPTSDDGWFDDKLHEWAEKRDLRDSEEAVYFDE